MGSVYENPRLGQIKSIAVRTAAKYDITPRWTGLAHLKSFGRSNICSRRISSASRFYGTGFGTEAALKLSRENASNAIYESIANCTKIAHNDPGNILRAEETYGKYQKVMLTLPILCEIAVFYPVEGEQLDCLDTNNETHTEINDLDLQNNTTTQYAMSEYFDICESLRHHFDYEICDSTMIQDGYLQQLTDFIIPLSCPVPSDTGRMILNWLKRGGRIWVVQNNPPWILETGEMLLNSHDDYEDLSSQICHFSYSDLPVFEPYAALSQKHAGSYITLHQKSSYSYYNPKTQEIGICDMEDI